MKSVVKRLNDIEMTPVLFNKKIVGLTYGRIKDPLPSNVFKYDIRHSDDDWGLPITVEPRVIVNFYGSIISDEEIPLNPCTLTFDGKDHTFMESEITEDKWWEFESCSMRLSEYILNKNRIINEIKFEYCLEDDFKEI